MFWMRAYQKHYAWGCIDQRCINSYSISGEPIVSHCSIFSRKFYVGVAFLNTVLRFAATYYTRPT